MPPEDPISQRSEEAHIRAAVAAHERAIARRAEGRLAVAERSCRSALRHYEAAEGGQHPDVANALVELALILEGRDRLREAARCHRRALVILARHRRDPDPDLARLALRARIASASIDRTLGNYGDAERGYRRALVEIRRRFGPRDPYVATVLNNLGVLRKAQGRYAEAFAFYKRALPLLARADGEGRATLAHNLGGIEHARGRYAQAEPFARDSVRRRRRLLGPDHPTVAADVAALAAIVEGRGRLEEAEQLYRQALAVFARRLGRGSLEAGLALASLAAVVQRRGALAPARALYGRALPILERLLGRRHPDVAMTVNNLAVLEREAGQLDRAAALFSRASRDFRAALGPRHPHTRLALGNLRSVAAESLKGRGNTRR